jgi:hypothetical protein
MRIVQNTIAPPSDNYNIDSPIMNQGASQIVDVPVDTPMPIYAPNVPVGGVKTNLLNLEIEPITPNPTESTTTTPSASTTTTPSATTTTTPSASANATITPIKKPNYLLYGGVILVAFVVYKLVKE